MVFFIHTLLGFFSPVSLVSLLPKNDISKLQLEKATEILIVFNMRYYQ